MFVKVLSGFSLGAGMDAFPGQVLEIDDRQAADLMYRRYVCEASPAETVKHLSGVSRKATAAARAAALAEKEAKDAAEAQAKADAESAKGAGGGDVSNAGTGGA